MATSGLLKVKSKRVLIVDECPIIIQGLRKIFAQIQVAKVVGEASTAESALFEAQKLNPDIIVLDPNFKVREPVALADSVAYEIDICRKMRSLERPFQIIAYTSLNTTADLMALALARIDGYVHKSTPTEQLVRILGSCIADGAQYWNLSLDHGEAQRRLLAASKVERLSHMEKEVLFLVLTQYVDEQISKVLHISPNTVKKHIGSTLRKLGYRYRRDIFRA